VCEWETKDWGLEVEEVDGKRSSHGDQIFHHMLVDVLDGVDVKIDILDYI